MQPVILRAYDIEPSIGDSLVIRAVKYKAINERARKSLLSSYLNGGDVMLRLLPMNKLFTVMGWRETFSSNESISIFRFQALTFRFKSDLPYTAIRLELQ